jgi:regulator of sigma E protease
VLPESPADDLGLVPGDYIVGMESGLDTLSSLTPEDALEFISANSEKAIEVSISREDGTDTYSIKPEKNIIESEPERAVLGISMGSVGFLRYSNPISAFKEGAEFTYDLTKLVWGGISSLFLSIFALSADFSDVAGPIGIVSVVGDAAEVGLASILFLTAIISINLAIINILPIPALDGGRLMFLVVETIIGRRLKPEVVNNIHAIFFGLLILLILVVSYFDIARLIG